MSVTGTEQSEPDSLPRIGTRRWRFRLYGAGRRRNHWIGMAGGVLMAIGPSLPVFSTHTGAGYNMFHVVGVLAVAIEVLGLAGCLLAQFGQTSALPVLAATVGMLAGWSLLTQWAITANGEVKPLSMIRSGVNAQWLYPNWVWLLFGLGVLFAFSADFADPQRSRRWRRKQFKAASSAGEAKIGSIPPRPAIAPPPSMKLPPRPPRKA